jgi:hypothetical protein
MTETERILALLDEMHNGDSWIGVDFEEVLDGVDARLAARVQPGTNNSIWALMNHVSYWRNMACLKLGGLGRYRSKPDFEPITDFSEEAWKATRQNFRDSYRKLRTVISEFPVDKLDAPSLSKDQTNYKVMHGVMQHDAYHLGQLKLLVGM